LVQIIETAKGTPLSLALERMFRPRIMYRLEEVLEAMCRQWPSAHLHTLLHRRGSVSPAIEQLPIQTSFLQSFPAVHRYYRYLLPLMLALC
jgi:hypothetical protein